MKRIVRTLKMSNSREFNLSIKDFQIIKNASLTFLPGLNCIIGQSNNGKSAIIRATKAAIYNVPGTTSVRLGCSSYAVGIQANGHTVIFQKGANSAYKIDGTTLSKIGRTQIPEVAEALGIKELNLNGSNEEINFLDQMEKPFLLDRSETELFRFIVDSGKDSNVTTALKSLTQDRQQITRDITTTEGKLELVETQLKQQEETLKDADSKLALYEKVIGLGPKITRSKELYSLKNTLVAQTESSATLNTSLASVSSLLDSISPSMEKISNATKKQELLGMLITNTNKASEGITQLKANLDKYTNVDKTKLEELGNKYNVVSHLVEVIKQQAGELNRLKEIKYPEVNPDMNSNVEKCSQLGVIINNINSLKQQIETNKKQLQVVETDLANTQKEINDLGVCPMCGKPLHVGG